MRLLGYLIAIVCVAFAVYFVQAFFTQDYENGLIFGTVMFCLGVITVGFASGER